MSDLSDELLAWYDRHARVMPWRVAPQDRAAGLRPDPYRVWLSEIMLQQTTVAAVRSYFLAFTDRFPTVADLAAAQDAEVMAMWAGLGYYARARNLLKCARVITAEYGGQFPETEEELLRLPGIGPYTAAAIAAIAFDQAATVVDGNVERVMARLHAVEDPMPTAKPQLRTLAAQHTPHTRPGDYAQAVMDLGATICSPKSPACGICPWQGPCAARAQGIAADLPRKLPKAAKPVRHGVAYVLWRADGALLLETRPDRGLLGGMLGLPTTDWGNDPAPNPPAEVDWQALGAEVRHTFTHFHLTLQVKVAICPDGTNPTRGTFYAPESVGREDLPTLMRKVYDLAAATRPPH